jgi:hypothetical protein
MLNIYPVTLEGYGIRLEPLAYTHKEGLAAAATDGKLGTIRGRFQIEIQRGARLRQREG